MARGKVISYSLSVNNCLLHHGVINGHRALGVTDKCFKVLWSRVLFLPWKRNTRYANLLFVLGDFQNRKWAPNWNWALKPATDKRPSVHHQVATFKWPYCPSLPDCQKVNINMLVNIISKSRNWWCTTGYTSVPCWVKHLLIKIPVVSQDSWIMIHDSSHL